MRPFEMSSSSSKDGFENCWPYEKREQRYIMDYRNPYGSHHPFYPTMGQPLIYCAQDVCRCDAPPCTVKNRSREHRRSPNCFVKAFRWYTQEHIPASECKNTCRPNRDISGFAAWLDVKYDQFLEESQMGSNTYRVKVRQTFEAERGPVPWKKKRRAKSNEGVTQQRSNHSCHYIMKPKDNASSRPPSVCCHPSCATSAASEYPNKSMCKSHSCSNITLTIRSKDVDESPAQGDMGDKSRGDEVQPSSCRSACKTVYKQNTSTNPSRTCSNTSVKKVEVSTTNRTISCQDFSCQCDKDKVGRTDTATQYDVGQPALMVTYKPEGPDCSCQSTEKEIVSKTTSKVTYEVVRPMESPCELGVASCDCIPEEIVSYKVVDHKESYRTISKVYRNVECQCSREKVGTVDAQTQCMSRSNTNNKCECDIKGSTRGDATPLQGIPMPASKLCPCGGKVKEDVATDQPSVKFAQTTSQTSNHSIYIEKKSAREYPLFLKIVCADKLSRENFK